MQATKTNDLDREQLLANFKEAEKFNVEKIKNNLVLLSLNLMNDSIDQKFSLPKALEQNKFIWARAMFEVKSLQSIISQYTMEITQVLEKEINKNKAQLNQYLRYIRPPD